jgi:nitrite reductase (NADH) small subunit
MSTTSECSAAPLDRGAWHPICSLERLTRDRGVAALVEDHAVAIFWLSSGSLHAVANVDPYSWANVLSRGIVGDVGGTPTVASPMYKQRFDLRTGACVDDPAHSVAVHDVALVDGVVHVRLAGPDSLGVT